MSETEKKPEEREVIQDLTSDDTKKLAYTKSFTVDYLNPEDGKRLVGTFTCHRPTLGNIGQLGVIKARLNGGENSIDRTIDLIHEMIAFCQVSLDDFPDWWDPSGFFTTHLLEVVYNHLRQFQDSFRNRSVGEQRSSPAANRSEAA